MFLFPYTPLSSPYPRRYGCCCTPPGAGGEGGVSCLIVHARKGLGTFARLGNKVLQAPRGPRQGPRPDRRQPLRGHGWLRGAGSGGGTAGANGKAPAAMGGLGGAAFCVSRVPSPCPVFSPPPPFSPPRPCGGPPAPLRRLLRLRGGKRGTPPFSQEVPPRGRAGGLPVPTGRPRRRWGGGLGGAVFCVSRVPSPCPVFSPPPPFSPPRPCGVPPAPLGRLRRPRGGKQGTPPFLQAVQSRPGKKSVPAKPKAHEVP
jgi:hypothetical protein